MNFGPVKDSLKPFALTTRETCLNNTMNVELIGEELKCRKSEYEENIRNYCGDDPLELWFDYISWVEQCSPESGRECLIHELLNKCFSQFGNNPKYFQDRRFIKLYIKFIDMHENPTEIYQQLYDHGIGTMVTDFYISWAYYYDLMENFNKANEIFIRGIDANAQPLDELYQAQKTFSLSIPARLLNRTEDDKQKFLLAMVERRRNLTSLKAYKNNHVGNQIKVLEKLSTTNNITSTNIHNKLGNIFQDSSKQSDNPIGIISDRQDKSITHRLYDKTLDKENKNQLVQQQSTIGCLGLSIKTEPENETREKLDKKFAIQIPSNFKRTNRPQSEFRLPLFISEQRAFCLPRYDKIMVYPGNGDEYSIEELRAWKYYKKCNIQNQFMLKYDKFWTNKGLELKTRIPPYFPNINQKQSDFATEPSPQTLPDNQCIHVCGWKNYDYSEDLSVENFLAKKWHAMQLKNKTVVMNISLDETDIGRADSNNSVAVIDESELLCDGRNNEFETPTASPAIKKFKISLEKMTSTTTGHYMKEDNEQDFASHIETGPMYLKPNISLKPFEIFTDDTVDVNQVLQLTTTESPKLVDSTEPLKVESNFKIFEDGNGVEFKEPLHTETIKKCTATPIQVTQLDVKENDIGTFATEDTFSTQNFVLFIKQQETSTPVQKKKRDTVELSKESDKINNTAKIPIKVMSSESLSSPESDVIPKQLSVIMETSETNTGGASGSGAHTKSSVDGNESSKLLFNCNHTVKSKTMTNGQNLSTIHESSGPREPSGKDTSKVTVLGISNIKLTEDSLTFPKSVTTKQLCYETDELCELFSKTPEKKIKLPIQSLKLDHISPKRENYNNSDDELLEFFKKSPKMRKHQLNPTEPIILNDSVTIPSVKDVLLNNNNENITKTNVKPTIIGTAITIPKNQSIMQEFTENISIFDRQKSKLVSNLNEENSDLIRFSTKISESDYFMEGDFGKSIYEPKEMVDDEENLDNEQTSNENSFQHKIINLNQTRQQIDNCVTSDNIDPWNVDLCSAFLEHLDFFNYLEKRDDCELINNVPSLKNKTKIEIAGKLFNSLKYISKGAYGFIYKAKDVVSDKIVVLKQERPPNCWEYYISLIITERIFIEFLPRFMVIDNAMIGNNSSIFVSDYVQYGTLLDVCNKIYTSTSRHIDELIVMVLAIELFTIVDLLHSADIIHGDIKPDNFLLTTTLSLDSSRPMLKLIDYGNSIDMQRFPPNTTFRNAIKTEDFICSEMKDGRPWTYQTDLFCLAGTLHVLLFGLYMKTGNKLGKINILTKLPRYFHKTVWERIFTSLLNVPDCQTFPNLQDFKLDLKEILAEKEKLVLDKICSFNQIIS